MDTINPIILESGGGADATSDNFSSSSSEAPPDITLSNMLDNHLFDDVQVPLNKDGTVRQKRGRKPGQTNAPKQSAAPVKTKLQTAAIKVSSEALANAILKNVVQVACVTIGEEWQFESQEEADGMKAAVAAYIESKGNINFSPETMLALVVAGYAIPRVRHQNTRQKLGAFFGKMGGWFKALLKR